MLTHKALKRVDTLKRDGCVRGAPRELYEGQVRSSEKRLNRAVRALNEREVFEGEHYPLRTRSQVRRIRILPDIYGLALYHVGGLRIDSRKEDESLLPTYLLVLGGAFHEIFAPIRLVGGDYRDVHEIKESSDTLVTLVDKTLWYRLLVSPDVVCIA